MMNKPVIAIIAAMMGSSLFADFSFSPLNVGAVDQRTTIVQGVTTNDVCNIVTNDVGSAYWATNITVVLSEKPITLLNVDWSDDADPPQWKMHISVPGIGDLWDACVAPANADPNAKTLESMQYNGLITTRGTRNALGLAYLRDLPTISASDLYFSNAVLAVGLNIDTNSVAMLNEIASGFGGFPIQGTATTVGGLLLAMAAAIAWLKKNKVGSFSDIGGTSASVENGVADLSDYFSESNTSLIGAVATSVKSGETNIGAAIAKEASGSAVTQLSSLFSSDNTSLQQQIDNATGAGSGTSIQLETRKTKTLDWSTQTTASTACNISFAAGSGLRYCELLLTGVTAANIDIVIDTTTYTLKSADSTALTPETGDNLLIFAEYATNCFIVSRQLLSTVS